MLVNQIVFEEPLISENRKPQLRRLVHKLIEKLETNESDDFYLFKVGETNHPRTPLPSPAHNPFRDGQLVHDWFTSSRKRDRRRKRWRCDDFFSQERQAEEKCGAAMNPYRASIEVGGIHATAGCLTLMGRDLFRFLSRSTYRSRRAFPAIFLSFTLLCSKARTIARVSTPCFEHGRRTSHERES